MEVRREFVGKAFLTISAKGFMSGQTQVVFTRGELSIIRAKAIRQGVWFRVLSRAERVYMELAIKVVDRICSHFVARLLTSIVGKLLNVGKKKVARVMEEIGKGSARKLSRIAKNWGNLSSCRWEKDQNFIQYLAVTYMNTPTFFNSH